MISWHLKLIETFLSKSLLYFGKYYFGDLLLGITLHTRINCMAGISKRKKHKRHSISTQKRFMDSCIRFQSPQQSPKKDCENTQGTCQQPSLGHRNPPGLQRIANRFRLSNQLPSIHNLHREIRNRSLVQT